MPACMLGITNLLFELRLHVLALVSIWAQVRTAQGSAVHRCVDAGVSWKASAVHNQDGIKAKAVNFGFVAKACTACYTTKVTL